MDAFFVSVELLSRPELRGLPVVVGGQKDQRGVVTSASYEARRFGIHSAMPLRTAGRLCPHAVFLDNRHELYSQWSDRIAAILAQVFARRRNGVGGRSVSRFQRHRAPSRPAARCRRSTLARNSQDDRPALLGGPRVHAPRRESRFRASQAARARLGCAGNRSRISRAARCPQNSRHRPRHEGALNALGILTVGQLAAVPLEKLEESFGRWGTALAPQGTRQDSYEFFVDAEPKSISHNQTFGADTHDRALLESTLSYLCAESAKRLRDSGLYTRTISLTIRYVDFRTVTRSKTLAEPTDLDGVILAIAKNLFAQNWDGRAILRLIGVSLESLSSGTQQLGLLDAGQESQARATRAHRRSPARPLRFQ